MPQSGSRVGISGERLPSELFRAFSKKLGTERSFTQVAAVALSFASSAPPIFGLT